MDTVVGYVYPEIDLPQGTNLSEDTKIIMFPKGKFTATNREQTTVRCGANFPSFKLYTF